MAWRRRQPKDAASTHVLEAVILSLVLLSAAYSVTALRDTGGDASRPRHKLEALSQDALIVLDGLTEPRGRLLDVYMAEAYHCALGTEGSEDACDGARPKNLSFKLENYLPHGVGYAYGIANSVAHHTLYRSLLPEGETVTGSRVVSPDWDLTFLATDLSCYESGLDATVLAMPVWHASFARPQQVNVTVNALNATAAEGSEGVWRATLPAATRPDSGIVRADVNATDGAYEGATKYEECSLAGLGSLIQAQLGATSFTVPSLGVPVAGGAVFAWDVSGFESLVGVLVDEVSIDVYAPLPALGEAPDRFARVATIDGHGRQTGVATWAVPADSLFGVHPVVLRATLDLPSGGEVEVRKLAAVRVALPTGEVPVDPIYRIVLQAWFPDWR